LTALSEKAAVFGLDDVEGEAAETGEHAAQLGDGAVAEQVKAAAQGLAVDRQDAAAQDSRPMPHRVEQPWARPVSARF